MNWYIVVYLLLNASICPMYAGGVQGFLPVEQRASITISINNTEPWKQEEGRRKEQEEVISYDSMPDLFLLDNYDRCLSSPGGTFCLLDIDFARVPGRLHEYIADYSSDFRRHFNHSRQHRGVCVSERCRLNSSTIDDTELLACLDSTDLQISQVKIRYCNTADQNLAPPDALDYSVAAIVIMFVLLAICGTVHDIMHQTGKCKENRYAMVFSVTKNWSKLFDKKGSCSRNTNTFHFLQGMRFLTMFVIIGIHAVMVSIMGFSINPQFFETLYDDPLRNWCPNIRIILQTFFAMSGFLLAHQILEDKQKTPFGLLKLPGAIFKRYVRFIPTMMVVVGLSATWLPRMGSGPLWNELVKREQVICRRHWWMNLLFIQNLYAFGDICTGQSWYLAADMQLHLLGLLLMVAVCRFRQHGWLMFSTVLVTSLLVSGLQTYFLHLTPIRVIFSPVIIYNFMKDATHLRGYMSAQSNWTGYTLGMITAYAHHRAQRNHWIKEKYFVLKGLYYLSVPLALVAVWIGAEFHTRPASTLEAVLFNTLDQNIFAAAMCIFILGCIYKCDKILRACVEWAPWQPLGKLSFCALLIHIIILGMYMGQKKSLLYVSEYSILLLVLATTALSYIFSVPLYLLVEQPSYRLHRILTSADGAKLSTCESTKDSTRV